MNPPSESPSFTPPPLPAPVSTPPAVLIWFRIYGAILTGCYFLLTPLGMVYLLWGSSHLGMHPVEAHITGWIFLIMSTPLAIAAALPLFLRPRPWVWIYDLIMICLGLSSCCFWPLCIPLLIQWIKPDTQRFFGRK